jgi:hypothetical protein
MRRIKFAFLAAIALAIIPVAAFADAPVTTLQANARVEYRLDYAGDGSPIKVVLTETDPSALVVSVYFPDQIDALRRGELPAPTGRGTVARADTLQWSAGPKIKGVYYVVVENRTAFVITYRMSITGDGVSGAARAMPSWVGATSTITTQNGQRTLNVSLPPGSITTTLRLVMPPQPATCTAAKQITGPIDHSIKLCPGQIYPPLSIAGDNIALGGRDECGSPVRAHRSRVEQLDRRRDDSSERGRAGRRRMAVPVRSMRLCDAPGDDDAARRHSLRRGNPAARFQLDDPWRHCARRYDRHCDGRWAREQDNRKSVERSQRLGFVQHRRDRE